MSIEMWTVLIFVCLFSLIFLGLPISFALGGTGILFTLIFMGPSALYMATLQAWGAANQFVLVAIPLFVFMAMIIDKSGVALPSVR